MQHWMSVRICIQDTHVTHIKLETGFSLNALTSMEDGILSLTTQGLAFL